MKSSSSERGDNEIIMGEMTSLSEVGGNEIVIRVEDNEIIIEMGQTMKSALDGEVDRQ